MSDTVDAEGEEIEIGDVVQIDPDADFAFGGCLLIVTELKGFGVLGFVAGPDSGGPSPSYYRAESKEIRRIGRAAFRVPELR